jgi:hypothetical protein
MTRVNQKETVWCDTYTDGVLTSSIKQERMVCADRSGARYVVTYWGGRKTVPLDANNHYRVEWRSIPAIRPNDFMKED